VCSRLCKKSDFSGDSAYFLPFLVRNKPFFVCIGIGPGRGKRMNHISGYVILKMCFRFRGNELKSTERDYLRHKFRKKR